MKSLFCSEFLISSNTWKYIRIPVIAGAIAVGIIIIIVAIICLRHVKFRRKCDRIYTGMARDDVFKIMGDPYDYKTHYDGTEVYWWKKSQWKGWLRGGTLVRSLVVTIKGGKVIKIIRNNMDETVL